MYAAALVKTFSKARLLRRQTRNLIIAAIHRAPASPMQSAGGKRQSSDPSLNSGFELQSFHVT